MFRHSSRGEMPRCSPYSSLGAVKKWKSGKGSILTYISGTCLHSVHPSYTIHTIPSSDPSSTHHKRVSTPILTSWRIRILSAVGAGCTKRNPFHPRQYGVTRTSSRVLNRVSPFGEIYNGTDEPVRVGRDSSDKISSRRGMYVIAGREEEEKVASGREGSVEVNR